MESPTNSKSSLYVLLRKKCGTGVGEQDFIRFEEMMIPAYLVKTASQKSVSKKK